MIDTSSIIVLKDEEYKVLFTKYNTKRCKKMIKMLDKIGPSRSTICPRDEFWVIFKMAKKLMKKRKRNQEIKVSLAGLSKFKEGVSNIQEMLSLRKRHEPSFARN